MLVAFMGRMEDAAGPATQVTSDEAQEGFEAFFRAEHARLLRALFIVTGDRQEAEDLMQEAFLSLWERWDRVGRMADPVGYLYRTALNAHRSRRRRLLRAARRTILREPATDDLVLADARDTVSRALARLTVRQRAALVLTELLGYGSQEAGSSVWPERTWEEAEAAQARADAGADAWRLQPASVGYRFAEEVLGWGRPGVEVMVGEVATGADRMLLRIHRLAAPCDLRDLRVGVPCPPAVVELELTVERLVRQGEEGIWSVTRVDSPNIDLPVDAGATLRIGEPVDVAMRPSAADIVLAVGWHLTAPRCPSWTGVATAPASDGEVVLTPDALPEGCEPPVPAVLYAWMGPRAGDLDPFIHPVQPLALEAVPVLIDVALEPPATTGPSPVPAIGLLSTPG